jgi:hypothetical protein
MVLNTRLTPYTGTLGGLSGFSLQIAVAAIATCAFWLFGYDMSVGHWFRPRGRLLVLMVPSRLWVA